jgi:hypothetical protein
MTDPLESWYRAAIAETMAPCRELPREERAGLRALAAIRDEAVDACAQPVEEVHEAAS